MTGLPDLATHPGALRVRKRPDPVRVLFAPTAGVCDTLEGPVTYRSGDAILTGARGERWPIQRNRFLASYEPVPNTDGLYRKRPTTVLALRIDKQVEVPVGWQSDPLRGNPGDWLLDYQDGSLGVIRDAIFRETYGPAPNETRWPPPLPAADPSAPPK